MGQATAVNPTARMAARFGRKRVVAACLITVGASLVGVNMLTGLPLILALAVQGFFAGGVGPVLLTILMDFSGIFGGYVAEAAVSGMSWQLYFERAFSYVTYSDIIHATLKTIVFGFLIAVVSSYLGFTTSRGTEGVGEASTRSVVMGSMLVIVSDVILVKIIFFFYPSVTG